MFGHEGRYLVLYDDLATTSKGGNIAVLFLGIHDTGKMAVDDAASSRPIRLAAICQLVIVGVVRETVRRLLVSHSSVHRLDADDGGVCVNI